MRGFPAPAPPYREALKPPYIHENTVKKYRRAGGSMPHSRAREALSDLSLFPAIFPFISFDDVARVPERIHARAREARDEK